MTMNESMRRLDQRPIPAAEPGVMAFLGVRNERARLSYLLDYHRRLGVRRFFVVDNDSSDGSVDLLLKEPDVHLWHTGVSYRDSHFGVKWAVALMNEFALDRWVLYLDADEFLVYPGCEQTGLSVVCDFLDQHNLRVLPTPLLDMYSNRPVIETSYEAGQDILSVCPYFDEGDYFFNPETGFIKGGVRDRLFRGAASATQPPIALSKFALRRWVPSDLDRGVHRSSLPGSSHPMATGALLHFKFIDTFVRRATEESVRKEHWNAASEYADYVRKFTVLPDLCLMGPRSIRYQDSEQLVRLGLMRAPTSYLDFVRNTGSPAGNPRITRFSAGGFDD
jgi:glycosyltransferase involved in cell wall biosynthesis